MGLTHPEGTGLLIGEKTTMTKVVDEFRLIPPILLVFPAKCYDVNYFLNKFSFLLGNTGYFPIPLSKDHREVKETLSNALG